MDDVQAADAELARQEGGHHGFGPEGRQKASVGPVLAQSGGVRGTGSWLAAEVLSISCR